MLCIVMTKAQADAVRGTSRKSPYAALAPSPLKDGLRYTLPLDVLTDPAHKEMAGVLAGYPQKDIAESERPNSAASS